MTGRGAYRRLVFLLTAFSALAPLSIDAYLPAFPAIGAALGASPAEVQQSLSAYLAALALMVLWHGGLADTLGRRRVVLAMTALYGAATLLCLFASSIGMLVLGRALQGVGAGAGVVVGRAMVRDAFPGPTAQRLLAAVAFFFAFVPAIAPVLGGAVHAALGWRAIFAVLALYAGLLWLLAWRWLPETPYPQAYGALEPMALIRVNGKVLRSPAFLLLALSSALLFNGFFAYVVSAPAFLLVHLGCTSQQFYWLFVPAVAGVMLGSLFSSRLAGRLSHARCIRVGFAVMLTAAAFNVWINAHPPVTRATAVLPIAIYALGMAIAAPSLTLMVLDIFPGMRGVASGALGFVQLTINAVTAASLAPALWGSTMELALGMSGFVLAGLLAYLSGVAATRPAPPMKI